MGSESSAAAQSSMAYNSMGRGYQPSASIASPVHSPALMTMKPPTMPSSKPKAAAPPVATFQTKTFDYEQKKPGKGPDMMM